MITDSILFSHYDRETHTFQVDASGERLNQQQVEQWMALTLRAVSDFMGEGHSLTITFITEETRKKQEKEKEE